MFNRIKAVQGCMVFLMPAMALIAVGCHSSASTSPEQSAVTAVASPQPQQAEFDTEREAVQALLQAAKTQDRDALHKLLGTTTGELASGDKVADENAYKTFVRHATEKIDLQETSPGRAMLYIGQNQWPFPIPLVKSSSGKWFFDTEAGKARILARRIGKNELETINVCRAYILAQREYASKERDDSGVLKYAQRIISHPGVKDGLYWDAGPEDAISPLGPLVADAAEEGYSPPKGNGRQPFHGYFFHILKKQGPDAAGGKYDYVINGNMIAGFGLVAWPAKYGNSGVMTFILNHQGKIYEKDLGPDTDDIARSMTRFNPDSTWALVKD